MKFSIITAVYNRASTVERAIRSLKHQNYPNVEHIVIDGGSNDGTLEILRRTLGDNAIIVSETDSGMYEAINKGLDLASGEIIGLLHSDDYFLDNDVLSQISECFYDGSINAVYADAAFFKPQAPEKIIRRYSSAQFTPSSLGWGWMPAHTTLFLRRDVYKKFGKYKIDYRIAADFDFVCRIFRDGQLRSHYIPKVIVHMQTGGLSTCSWRSTLTLNLEMMRACRQNQIRTNWLKLLSRYFIKVREYFRS